MQIGEKGQTAESPNPPKPNRFPLALRLDALDRKRFIFIVYRVESRSARKWHEEENRLHDEHRPTDYRTDGPQNRPKNPMV